MTKLHSLKTEIILLLLGLASILVITGIFFFINLNSIVDSVTKHTKTQMPSNMAIQKALLALESIYSELGTGFSVEEFSDIQEVSNSEVRFNRQAVQYLIYTEALLLGSESDDFRKIHSGLTYRLWKRQGLDKKLIVPKSDIKYAEIIKDAQFLFLTLIDKSEKALMFKRKDLRLDNLSIGTTYEDDQYKVLTTEIRKLKEMIGVRMDQLVETNNQQSVSGHNAVMISVANAKILTFLSILISLILKIFVGWYFSKNVLIMPLKKIQLGSQKIAAGDFDYKVEVGSSDELGTLAKDFNIMAGKLKERDRHINELSSTLKLLNTTLRHDTLNDLSLIKGNIDLYSNNQNSFDSKEMLEDMSQAAQRGINFINKMKDLESQISTGTKLEQLDLRKVIGEVKINFPMMKFNINGEGSVAADDALISIIENLIRNVEMHAGTESVNIEITKKGEFLDVEIIDEGKGIPEEVKGKLFSEGFKFGETGHTGMGLYIIKKTIERYGGLVSMRDNKPKGSVFVLTFPILDNPPKS